jgi:hypothetical protein
LSNMKSILAQASGARRKSCDQTNLHSSPVAGSKRFDVLSKQDVADGLNNG